LDHQPQFLDLELEPTHRFNDPINKTSWHAMCYSPDGEWLAGGEQIIFLYPLLLFLIYNKSGAADPAGHKIYIWDISNDGQLASALDGGREPLVHLHVNRLTRSILIILT
jgi:COMPASS component SWD1